MLTERVKKLTPYIPGEQPRGTKLIKLNTNENPYPPSPDVAELLGSYNCEQMKLYPDPLFTEAKKSISRVYNVPEECIFISNGSDELLAFCFYAFFESIRGPLLFPDITYSFYPVYCNLFDIEYREIPLDSEFHLSLDEYIETSESTGTIFPNPNAPTGAALSRKEIQKLLDKIPSDRVVVIDEAYVDFGGESVVPLIEEYENLFVVKTMSKSYSLAGMRLGYAFGQKPLIQAVTAVKDSFNSYPVSVLGQKIICAAVEDRTFHDKNCGKIIKTRDRLIAEFRRMGWKSTDSKSNFVFVSKPGMTGETIQKRLRDNNILVRRFNHPRIKDWLRISIGLDEDADRLLSVCRGFQ